VTLAPFAALFSCFKRKFIAIKFSTRTQTHFDGSYLIKDRRNAFLSMVRLIVSVSDALCVIGVGLVLLELPEPADVIVCDAIKRFPLRFDSSKAFNASCVSAD
jgi:hypothetical protein